MPLFTPGRRWQPPFAPFGSTTRSQRLWQAVEFAVKGPLFGCRMCGNCLLQETAFICPMACPKGARNGPCGGSTAEACYVDPTRPCIWYRIYQRSFRMNRQELLLEVLPPLDWAKVGGETWGDVCSQVKSIGFGKVVRGLMTRDAPLRASTWDSIFRTVRQPEWWQGDNNYHPPRREAPASELQRRLRAGEFVVTAEVAPPTTADVQGLLKNIELLKPLVAAINFTDSPSAAPRTASWACSAIAHQHGVEPVMQIAGRDRTRVVLQSEAMGAFDLGIRNILCVSGDSMRLSPPPRGRMDILDLDAVQMLWILRRMRDDGRFMDGREIKSPPDFFLGAAASPMASEPRFQALREHKKVNAGAQFLQTNVIFDVSAFEVWLNELDKRGVLGQVFVLVGITPLKSLKMARYLDTNVPGVMVPKTVLRRMELAEAAGGAQEEGVRISLELIEGIRMFHGHGVAGLHIMAVGWEMIVPRILKEAGLVNGVVSPDSVGSSRSMAPQVGAT